MKTKLKTQFAYLAILVLFVVLLSLVITRRNIVSNGGFVTERKISIFREGVGTVLRPCHDAHTENRPCVQLQPGLVMMYIHLDGG